VSHRRLSRFLARQWGGWVVALAVLGAMLPESLAAQAGSVRLVVSLAPDSAPTGARAPVVRSENLLASESRWLTALRSGLPVRLHYRVEIWRSRNGWFDDFAQQVEWDVVVRHEPLLDHYTLLTLVGQRRQERRYATLDALGAALAFAYQVNVRPDQPGGYYYAASLQVSTLSDSDLDELKRFLEGDIGEAAQGGEGIGDAVGRGTTRLLLRLAGLPSLRLEARSPRFVVR
jgi:Domain of unknown function (DUF4390)